MRCVSVTFVIVVRVDMLGCDLCEGEICEGVTFVRVARVICEGDICEGGEGVTSVRVVWVKYVTV